MTLADYEARLAIVRNLRKHRDKEKSRLKKATRILTQARILGTIRGLSRAIRAVEKAT